MPPLKKIQLPASVVPPARPSARRARSRRIVAILIGLIIFLCYYYQPYIQYWQRKKTVLIPDPLITDPESAPLIDSFLLEIADLMGEWYELFVDMRFLAEEAVIYPPYSPPIDVAHAASLGMGATAIQLIQHLPYVHNSISENWGNGESPFVLGGDWAIYVGEDSDLEQLRDPFYASPDDENWSGENGPYMRPDYVALSALGNHGTAMILNIKDRQLWTIDQESGNSDPTSQDVVAKDMKNRNALEGYPSRNAVDALKDYIGRYRNLEWIPGGAFIDDWEGYNYAKIYRECGWPGSLDGTAFDKAREAFEESEHVRYREEEPIRRLKRVEYSLKFDSISLKQQKEQLARLNFAENSPTNSAQEGEDLQEAKKKIEASIKKLVNVIMPRNEKEFVAARQAEAEVSDDVRRRYQERHEKFGDSYY